MGEGTGESSGDADGECDSSLVAGCLAVIGGWSTGVSTISLPTARNGRAGTGDSGARGVGRGRESEIVAEGPMQISGLFKLRRIRLQCH